MSSCDSQAEQWLDREDRIAREGRLSRLKWIESLMPNVEYLLFQDGFMSKSLFEEARYCFVYGQFIATIVCSLAFIERSISSLLYASGRNDLERASISTLADQALEQGWLNQEEYKWIEELRKIRNPIVHFRKPGPNPGESLKEGWWRNRIENRSVIENRNPYDILEQDAQHALEIVYHLIGTSLMSV